MVATIIGQTLRYSWSVRMYRPFLHSADCPIGKQLFCCCCFLFFFKSSKITTCCISLDLCTCLLKRNHRQTPQSATNVFFINAASCNQTAGISSNPSYECLFLTHKGEVKVWERKQKTNKKKETKPAALERKLKCQARARFETK